MMETLDVHKHNSLCDMNSQDVNISVLELMRGDHHICKDELNKSLMSACKHRHKLLVQMLVGRGADVNYRDTNGNTPLLISVQNRFTDIVQFLLQNKADVNACNSVGDSALILSIHSSGSKEIEYLLKQPGINIDHQNQDGYMAIMKAAEVKDVETVKILLDAHYKKHPVTIYETVDGHKEHEQTSDSFSDVVLKWTMLDETLNCKGENVQQIAKRCGIGNIFQLLQKLVVTNISPLELAMRANDIKSFLIFLDCDFIYAANKKKKYLDETLKQIFKACSNKDITDLSEDEIAMVKALLEHGANVNTTWHDESLILDHTSDFDREQAGSYKSETLYNQFSSAQKTLYCAREVTPLLIAVKSGCFRVVQLLLSFKAEVKRFAFQNSPLHVTLSYGHITCAKLLVQHGAVIDFDQALELAVDLQEPKYVRFLMDNYKNEIMEHLKRFSKIDILIRSVRRGSLEIIDLILDLGADINGTKDPNLCPLVESKNEEYTPFRIGRGANVKDAKCIKQIKCPSPLIKILNRWDIKDNSVVEVIQLLLENGASVNDKCGDGKTPLILAAVREDTTNVLQLFMDHGAELGEVDEEGNTALMHAIQNGSVRNVSFLLQFVKDREELLNIQNDEGLTALILAVDTRSQTVIKELIDHSADVNIKDSNGNTALLYLLLTSDKHEDEMIKSLVQAGCDVNWQNNDGLSPLMVAARNYLLDSMSVLLDLGAEINAVSTDEDTGTALKCLLYQHYEDANFGCLEVLLNRGACSSYVEATTFHKIICDGHLQIVPKLIRCGLGPVGLITSDLVFSDLTHYIMFSYIPQSSDNGARNKPTYSPLYTALCTGNTDLARFFVGNLYLTQSDIFLLGHNKLLRHYLKRQNCKESLEILNEISAQPMSLFSLSFVAVSTAVGTTPGRKLRVNKLQVPQIVKDKLLFKNQDVSLTIPKNRL